MLRTVLRRLSCALLLFACADEEVEQTPARAAYTKPISPTYAHVGGSTSWQDDGRSHPEWSTSAAWVEVDGDGWLDLFVVNYVRWSPATDSSREITEQAGLLLTNAKSMGVAIADFNGDRLTDLVVTNDTQPNFLLQNRGDDQFEELGLSAGIGYDETGRARAA